MRQAAPPTQRQLTYLRALAARTASTFASPATRAEASREIERMRRMQRADPRMERAEQQPASRYATAIAEDELEGYGINAHWRTARPGPSPQVRGRPSRVLLGRYKVSSGERVLYGTRSEGRLRILDTPSGTTEGRSYPVEELSTQEPEDALDALIADYLARARELDAIPMAEPALEQMLGIGTRDV